MLSIQSKNAKSYNVYNSLNKISYILKFKYYIILIMTLTIYNRINHNAYKCTDVYIMIYDFNTMLEDYIYRFNTIIKIYHMVPACRKVIMCVQSFVSLLKMYYVVLKKTYV